MTDQPSMTSRMRMLKSTAEIALIKPDGDGPQGFMLNRQRAEVILALFDELDGLRGIAPKEFDPAALKAVSESLGCEVVVVGQKPDPKIDHMFTDWPVRSYIDAAPEAFKSELDETTTYYMMDGRRVATTTTLDYPPKVVVLDQADEDKK